MYSLDTFGTGWPGKFWIGIQQKKNLSLQKTKDSWKFFNILSTSVWRIYLTNNFKIQISRIWYFRDIFDTFLFWKNELHIYFKDIMTKCVTNIAKNTEKSLVKNCQIVNSKATNPKFRTWSKKYTLMQLELRLNSNLKEKLACKQGWKTYFIDRK